MTISSVDVLVNERKRQIIVPEGASRCDNIKYVSFV